MRYFVPDYELLVLFYATHRHSQIPMIVLYVFGIPIVAFIVLRNNRNELHDIETRRKYSFLYAVRKRFHLFLYP